MKLGPSERDPTLLARLVCSPVVEEKGPLSESDLSALRRLVSAKVKRDFALDQVLEIRKFVLSVTELRLYAFIALTEGR